MTKRIIHILSTLLTVLLITGCTSDSNEKNKKPAVDQTGKKEDMQYNENDEFLFDSMTPYDGEKLKIAFIGDSITMGYGADDSDTQSYTYQLQQKIESRYIMLNYGKGGAYAIAEDNEFNAKKSTPEKYYRNTAQYQASLTANADIVVIMLGTNDVRSLMISEEVRGIYTAAMGSLIEEYESFDSVKKVYLATSINSHVSAEEFNIWTDGPLQELQKEIAELYNVEVIDIYGKVRQDFEDKNYFCADGLHPNTKGYTVMANAFYDWLSKKNQ